VRATLAAHEQSKQPIPDHLYRQWWQAVGGVLAWHGNGHAPGALPPEIANRLCFMAGDLGAGHIPELISKAIPKHKPGERPIVYACKHAAVVFVLAAKSGKIRLWDDADPIKVVCDAYGVENRKTIQRWVKHPHYRETAEIELAAASGEEILQSFMNSGSHYRESAPTRSAISARNRKRS
jgi:hypothetical protein